jgi:hypothetical protein
MTNPYRDKMVQQYRQRLLKALSADDLSAVFAKLERTYPRGEAHIARYILLRQWDDAIRDAILERIGEFL